MKDWENKELSNTDINFNNTLLCIQKNSENKDYCYSSKIYRCMRNVVYIKYMPLKKKIQ